MLGVRQVIAASFLLAVLAVSVNAASFPAGTISLALDPNLGFYAIRVYNLTGDPAQGGSGLPPAYPVLTSLTFTQARLTYVTVDQAGNQVTRIVALNDIRPGLFTSADLTFDKSAAFQSITFSAVIMPATFDTPSGTYTSSDMVVLGQLKRQDGKPIHAFDSADIVIRQADPAPSGSLLPRRFGRQPLMTMVNCTLPKRRETFVS